MQDAVICIFSLIQNILYNISFPTAQKSYCITITTTSRVTQFRDMIPAVMKQMKYYSTNTSRLKYSLLNVS